MVRVHSMQTLLQRWQNGDDAAMDQIQVAVFDELLRLATYQLARYDEADCDAEELANRTWQALRQDTLRNCRNRAHLLALSAREMRRILSRPDQCKAPPDRIHWEMVDELDHPRHKTTGGLLRWFWIRN